MRIFGWLFLFLCFSFLYPQGLPANEFIRLKKISENLRANGLSPSQQEENSLAALAVYGLFNDLEISENTLNQLMAVYLLNKDTLKTGKAPQAKSLSYHSLHRLLIFYQLYFQQLKSFTPDKMKFFQLFTRDNPFKPLPALETQEHEKIYQWILTTLTENSPQIEKIFSPQEFFQLRADLAENKGELPQKIQWLEKALKISFSTPLFHALIQAYAQNKQYAQAETLLAPLIKTSPLWQNLWETLKESKIEEERTAALEKQLTNSPNSDTLSAKLELSRLYRLNDRAPDSLKLLKTFPESERSKGTYLKEKALSEFALGNLQLSEIALHKGLDQLPKDLDLNGLKLIVLLRGFLFSLSNSESGDYIQIRAEVEKITSILFEKNLSRKQALLLLLDWIFSGQTLNDREKDIQALEKSFPTALETSFLKAALSLHQKNPQEALKSLIQIKKSNLATLEALKGFTASCAVELPLLIIRSHIPAIKDFLSRLQKIPSQPSKQITLLNANALLALARLTPSEPFLYDKSRVFFESAYAIRADESQEESELNLMTRNNLGVLYAEKGQLKHAFEFFKSAREQNPELLAPHLNLIICLHKNRETQSAQSYLDNLLQEFPLKDPFEKLLILYWKSLLLEPQSSAYKKNLTESSALLEKNPDLPQKILRGEYSPQLLTAGYFSLNPTFTLRKGFSTPITLSEQVFFLLNPDANHQKLESFLNLLKYKK